MNEEKEEVALLPKYQKFLDCYLKTWNATKSYLKVNPKVSRASAAVSGYEWVKKLRPTIQQMSEAMNWTLLDDLKMMRNIVKGKVEGFGYRERADLLKAHARIVSGITEEEEAAQSKQVTIKVIGGGYDPNKVEEDPKT